ncbi:MAG: hypothetical protein ACI8UO_006664 [Verrucomicrobiales bacterium]|jgi:hypothetical protein
MSEYKEGLTKLESYLEADVLEAERLLELGKEAAIAELKTHQKELGIAYELARDAIIGATDLTDLRVQQLLARLGELNYLLAEDAIENLKAFDETRDNIIRRMEITIADLQPLEVDGGKQLVGIGARLAEAWNQFERRLLLVRAQLGCDWDITQEEFQYERGLLLSRFERLGRDKLD